MGDVTAREMSRLLPPPYSSLVRAYMPLRQTRRCPYLFSVAPPGYQAAVKSRRVPPSRVGFPPTHALLEECWQTYVAAMERRLTAGPSF